MILFGGIAPEVGAALIAGVFALLNTALTLYIINRNPRGNGRRMMDVERVDEIELLEPPDIPDEP